MGRFATNNVVANADTSVSGVFPLPQLSDEDVIDHPRIGCLRRWSILCIPTGGFLSTTGASIYFALAVQARVHDPILSLFELACCIHCPTWREHAFVMRRLWMRASVWQLAGARSMRKSQALRGPSPFLNPRREPPAASYWMRVTPLSY